MKKIIVFVLAAVMLLSLAACGKEYDEVRVVEAELGVPTAPAVYYHGDEAAEKLVEETAELPSGYEPQDVLDLLYEKSVLPEKVTVISWSVDGSGLMNIDLSEEFGAAIKGQGTAGEYIMMGSLVNSLIKNFDLKNVLITVNGDVLESGHEIYDYPLSLYEN